ncbi:hypothetical protein M673_00685 [Aureimonas sp. AU20]|nr:hypothetical protein M673_00685 [Aureimonas sp. AU20]
MSGIVMSERLDLIVSAALRAGAAIMAVYERGASVETKPDGSPVTEADRMAEAILLDALGRHFPDIPVVAEEEAAEGRVPAIGSRFFLVDPLDGTREFIGRNGEFTVNIGLVEDGTPTLGVIYAPCLGRVFAGEGESAWQGEVEEGEVVSRRAMSVRPAPHPPVAVASRSHCSTETTDWLDRHAICDVASRGSSLKFCLLASGEADLYPRFGRTMEWDTAAGQAILQSAGGRVITPDGLPLRYGKRGICRDTDFENGAFLAIGDPGLHRTLG